MALKFTKDEYDRIAHAANALSVAAVIASLGGAAEAKNAQARVEHYIEQLGDIASEARDRELAEIEARLDAPTRPGSIVVNGRGEFEVMP